MANPNMIYTVRRGETLSDIAQRHGTNPKQLCTINGIKNPNHIMEGQKIALSAKAVCKVKVQVLDRDRNPISAAMVRLDYNGKKKELSSNDKGWLSTILTKTPDDNVSIFIQRLDGSWKRITDVTSGWGNKIATLVSPRVKAEGTTVLHPKDASGKPIRDDKPSAKPQEKPKTANASWSYGDGQKPKTEVKKDSKGLTHIAVSNEPRTVVEPEKGLVPWMEYAKGEAKKYKGADEKDITKTINYHKEIGASTKTTLTSLAGDKNPWCASFANWCLKRAKYPIANPRNLGVDDRRAAADGFRQVHKGKKAIPNPLFIQIPEPVYGAIAVVVLPKGKRDDRPGKHVGFVYGRSNKNKICILGGNQTDTICFENCYEKETIISKTKTNIKTGLTTKTTKLSNHLEFYMPTLYHPIYEMSSKTLPNINAVSANKSMSIIVKPKEKGDNFR